MLGQLIEDLRYSARTLAKTRSFTIVAILTLSLGIGATTAVFSVANALLFRPLPYADPARLVIVTNANGPNRRAFSYYRARFLQEHGRSFAGFAPFVTAENFNLTGRGDPELVPAVRVAWNFFEVLGVRPMLGRAFRTEEDQPGGRPVVILSDSFWKRRLGADPAVIGQNLTLDSIPTTIIGVMPPNFEFAPLRRSVDIWSTRTFETNSVPLTQARAGVSYLIAIARIRRGVRLDQARSEMRVLDAEYRRDNPALADADPQQGIGLNQVQDLMVEPVRNAVLVLLGAVAFLLLIACANVASLLLSRALARRQEIAIRTALGATRTGLIRQLLTESIFLAFISGGLGVVLSAAAVRFASLLPPLALPRINPVRIDLPVLAFAVAASMITGVLFGLLPALQVSKVDVQGALRDEGRGIAGRRIRNLTRSLLVVWQIAISMMLLIGAGLLMRSFVQLEHVRLGFNPERLLLVNIALPPTRYSTPTQVAGFFERALSEAGALPGVRAVGLSSGLPLHPWRYAPMLLEGLPEAPLPQRPLVPMQAISPSYFQTMGIPLLRGRFFDDRDKADAPLVAIVNDAMVQYYWPGENAIGKHIVVGNASTPIQVVGVTGSVKNIALAVIATPEMYCPLTQFHTQSMNLIVRSAGNPLALSTPLRSAILALDRDQPVTNVRTMEQHLADSITPAWLTTLLLAIFSAIALLVAAVGLYGLIAYSVAQRTQELGIRLALGAGPGKILTLVLREGLALATLGVLFGAAGSLAFSRILGSLLFEVSATDGWTFTACALSFIGIALAASYVPARRAARLDPTDALRSE
jgi:predicted permease